MQLQKRNLIIFLLLFLFVFIAYSNNYNASWHMDDYPNIVDNPRLHIKDFKFKNFEKALFAGYDKGEYASEKLYRPLPMLTFALNWYTGKDNVLGYHIVNNLIHLVTTIFLFLTVLNLLMSPNLKDKYQGNEHTIAFLAAIFWAVNPIQTQAVTYIIQRMASLAAMFYIIGIYFYLKARISPPGNKTLLFIAGSLISFVCAIISKENAVTFPFSVLIVEILFFQNLSNKNIKRKMAISFAIIGASTAVILTILYINGYISIILKGYHKRMFTLGERLMTEPRIIIYYLGQIFYPIASRLSFVHDVEISTTCLKPWTTIPAFLTIISLLGFGFSQAIKRPVIAFAIFFFFMNQIIESSIIPLELIFEHRNYLPSLFLFFPVSTGLVWLVDYFQKKNSFLKKLLLVTIAGIIFSFCVGTIVRNRAWATEKTLWEDCIIKAPGMARPYHNLANYHYQKIGKMNTAMVLYEMSLNKKFPSSKTGHALTYNNMATIFYNNGDFKSSIKLLHKALKIKPGYLNARKNITLLYVKAGEFSKALDNADRLLSLNKESSDFLQTKGFVLLSAGRWDDAITILKSALDIDPNNKKANLYMGLALCFKKKYKKADTFLRQAYLLSPDDIFVHFARIENSIKSGNKEALNHLLKNLFRSFDKSAIDNALERLDKNNIIAPLSQKLLSDAIN